jgi:hypothetical protein
LGDGDRREAGILRRQDDDSAPAPVALDGEFAVEQCQHDAVVGRRDRPIDHGDITWKKPDADHAFAGESHGERGGGIGDQQFVEIERTVEIILGRRGEAALDDDAGERHRHAVAGLHVEKFIDVAGAQVALRQAPGKCRYG